MLPCNIGLVAVAHWSGATGVRAVARLAGAALLASALAACQPELKANPHYVVGTGYQAGGTWWYPRETYDLDETGLATVYPAGHPPLTTDGEVFSQSAIAAGHATVQLPAVARLTNLETGRSLLVRINDRGAPTPGRLVQVTSRAASLLGIPADGVAQVRLTILPGPSQAAAQRLPGAPSLGITAAPRTAVASIDLPPPSGVRQEAGRTIVAAAQTAVPADDPPDHVPESVTQGPPHPGRLLVRLDTFQSYQYAAVEQAKLSGLSARIDPVFEGKLEGFRVVIGPLPSIAAADAAVAAAIRAGIGDARIVVE